MPRLLILATLAVVAGALLAACSNGGGNGGGNSGDVSITPISHLPTPTTVVPLPTAAPGDPFLEPVGRDTTLTPENYIPPDLVDLPPPILAMGGQLLRKEAAGALEQWLGAAAQAGFDIKVVSGFRSYDDQVVTFDYWKSQLGEAEALRSSALPGHSEHQLGTTVDLGTANLNWQLDQSFGDTPEGQWLATTAADYGFVLSYPRDGEPTTGYEYEPWHFRYVGVEHARAVQREGVYLIQHLRAVATAAAAGG